MYSNLANQFLKYGQNHPEGAGDIYDRFRSFLLFIGLSPQEADHEVGLFMNRVCNLMD